MALTESEPVHGKDYYNPATQSQADVSAERNLLEAKTLDSTIDDDRRNIDDNDTGTYAPPPDPNHGIKEDEEDYYQDYAKDAGNDITQDPSV